MGRSSTRLIQILCKANTFSRRRRSNSMVPRPFNFHSYSYRVPEFPQIFIYSPRIACKKSLLSHLLPATPLLSNSVAAFFSIGAYRVELGETQKRATDENKQLPSFLTADPSLPQGKNGVNRDERGELGHRKENSNPEQSLENCSALERNLMADEAEVEQICKILREDNDLEISLAAMMLELSPELVQRVLMKCHGIDEELANRFFVWAKSQRGYMQTSETYNEMVKIAVRKKDFKYVAHLLARMKAEGLSSSRTFVFLTKEGDAAHAVGEMLQAFSRLRFPQPKYAYDALLPHLCQANCVELALAVIQRMIHAGYHPVPQTYVALSGALCEGVQTPQPQEILGRMRRLGYRPDGNTCNYILKALCAVGKVDEAYAFLDSMRSAGCEPDSLSYHIMIWGACEIGEVDGALQLLERMIVHESFTPRQKTYATIIRALDRTREYRKACELITFLNENECFPNPHNYQMVAEMCYENFEAVAAAKILIQMTERGYIPHIKLRQRVFHSLIGKGEQDLAWKFRYRLMDLRS